MFCVQVVSGGPQSAEGHVVREMGSGHSTCCPQRSLETGACIQRILSARRPGVPLVRGVVFKDY